MDLRNILAKFDAVEKNTSKKTFAEEKQKNTMSSLLESLDRISEAAKPDFLDVDKDGDKKEPMSKAAKEKDEDVKESKYPWLDHPDRPGAKKNKDDSPVKEGAPAYSPTYIQHLQIQYGDKKELDSSDKYKIADIIKKSSIENLKQLVAANIPHVSNAAKNYIRIKTPGGMKEEVELEEAIMVSAEGSEAEALLQILKLSGMPTPAPAALPALPPEPNAAPAADLDTMDIEMQDEYSNSPDEFEQDVDAVIANGTDLHREKGQYPAAARGDNPMAAFEGKFKAIMADLLKE